MEKHFEKNSGWMGKEDVIYMGMYVYICVCVCVYYMCVYTHTHTHTHTHIQFTRKINVECESKKRVSDFDLEFLGRWSCQLRWGGNG